MATRRTKSPKTANAPVEKTVVAGKDTVETMIEAGREAAAQNVEKAVKITQEQIEKANDTANKTIDEIFAFNKNNVDAVVAAGNLYLKGLEAINKELVAYTQKSVEIGLANAKDLLAAKSLKEAIELHADYTKAAFDNVVAETAKISEMSKKVANDSVQPISSRVQTTVDTIIKSAA